MMKNRKARSNEKKVSENLFETRNQKNKEKPQLLKVEMHHSTANVEDPEEQKANEGEARRIASELTPVEQRHDFAISTGALDCEEMSELSDISLEKPASESSLTDFTIRQGAPDRQKTASSFLE